MSFFTNRLIAQRLEMLREVAPRAALIAVLINPRNARAERDASDMQAAAAEVGQQILLLHAGTPNELDESFSSLVRAGAGALLMTSDAFFTTRRQQVVALAAQHAVPAIYGHRDYTTAGGLMSYGSNIADSHRQAGAYVGRILKGAAGGACAAAGQGADHRVPWRQHFRGLGSLDSCVCAAIRRAWLDRGPQRSDRVSLGRRTRRAFCRVRG